MTSFPILLHFLLILLISIITICPSSTHACHEDERRALLNFKSSLDDPSNRLSSWKESIKHRNCCDWGGIKCSKESLHVISIDLRNTELENYNNDVSITNNPDPPPQPDTALRGKLSPSLCNITHLEYLDIAYNDFEESKLTFQFSDLPKLTHLDLSFAIFSGSISTQFSNLSFLEYLDLSCSFFCLESPSTKWIQVLVNLQVLRLSGMDLLKATSSKETFSEHISYLTSLSILELDGCNLQGSIPYLPQLKEFNVRVNRDLRPNVTRMFEQSWPKLQVLQISQTNATGSIPTSISNAPLLISFSADQCSIQGSLPSSISNLKYLNYLDLSSNNIQGPIPYSICEILPLQHLDLRDNNITGTIPSCITKLRNLSFLDVSQNSIRGTVSLIPLINELDLTHLDLNANKLTVVINPHLHPSKFKLKHLDLRSCSMEGFIPNSFCNFTHLEIFDFSDNNLTGAIPPCISKLKKLIILDLSKNKLNGLLPLLPRVDHIVDLSKNKLNGEISIENGKRLTIPSIVSLSYNELSGSIPSSLCSHKPGMSSSKTEYINLSNNKLSGTLPSTIGDCIFLRYLNLGNNNLTGILPTSLGSSLEYLALSDNNLNGTFPMFILEMFYLIVLNLGNNNFEGILPTGIFDSLGYLKILSLRSNRFNGSIPEEIMNMGQLQILDLSVNNFSGLIPSNLGNLTSLTRGTLSESTGSYSVQYQLTIKGTTVQLEQMYLYNSGFDLSCNIFDGRIPEEIGLLKELVMLNLSHNHFWSNIPASVGNMSGLQSLDLSSNRLSGSIPQNLTSIDRLGFLNLSHNNLSGRIPRDSHFDTLSLDGSAFAGNDLLCGFPLVKVCDGDHFIDKGDTGPSNKVDEDDQEDGKERFMLYAIVAMGFVVGFWGLFLVMLLKKQIWWFPYWKNVDSVAVRIVECINKKQQ
ncbi:hypothetical protein MKW92_025122 [Papaver armeniacum]|nr:hypothetical protein MKW92_025122 [Papaver armeniacum]